MDKTTLATLTLLLLAPLGALADPTTPGIPDTGCQTPAEWRVHDYIGTSPDARPVAVDGNVGGCPSGSWDGDAEFGLGGAYLYSRTGDGSTDGSLACHGGIGHHPQGGVVTATDLSGPVVFVLVSDASNPLAPPRPGEPDCGDGVIQPCPGYSTIGDGPQPIWNLLMEIVFLYDNLRNMDGSTCNLADHLKECASHETCVADFPPGADGSYVVLVGASLTGAEDGLPTTVSAGHIHL